MQCSVDQRLVIGIRSGFKIACIKFDRESRHWVGLLESAQSAYGGFHTPRYAKPGKSLGRQQACGRLKRFCMSWPFHSATLVAILRDAISIALQACRAFVSSVLGVA